jgi:hypothetical protein
LETFFQTLTNLKNKIQPSFINFPEIQTLINSFISHSNSQFRTQPKTPSIQKYDFHSMKSDNVQSQHSKSNKPKTSPHPPIQEKSHSSLKQNSSSHSIYHHPNPSIKYLQNTKTIL